MANPCRRRLRVKRSLNDGLLYADIHGTPAVFQLVPQAVKSKEELMVDTVGYLEGDFNPCFHDKVLIGAKPLDHLTWEANPLNPSDNVSYTFSGGTGILWPDLISVCRDRLQLPYDDNDLDDFSAKAEHHFKTAVDDTHSLLNFLIELIQMCEGNIVKLKELGDKLAKALKAFWKMYAETGNYWLSWNFCIKPTVGDLKAMASVLKAARKRLKWLQSRNNLDTKVKYRQGPWSLEDQEIELYEAQWPATDGPMYLVPPNCFIRIKYSIRTVPSSYGWVRFSIPSYLLEGPEGLGIVWAALAGLYNPVKVGWEAVPFSWLIDWFVSKRTQLQLEAASLSPLKDAEIIGTGHSLRTEVFGSIQFVGPPYELGGTEQQVFDLGEFKYERYVRTAGLPTPAVSPFRLPLEWYNGSIIAALLQQKHRRG